MIKTVFAGLITFIGVSSLLLLIGYLFHFKLFMFSFYEETSTGFEAGGSVIPFIIAIICSYFIGNYYQKRQHSC
ncbi:hypothetical protein [Psychrobacillus sp. OK032]|uniref:hypothetical protein n=1 Tax=Psychrobacillus sp. OK032 TaxID=1884358 RepID=UPI0008BB1F64|nr:hypothetical protein [Psychrobacillus sp. OK032]SES37372.1 hypothetical protein SAMN05518872_10959 [Psychrobacillus sp. OK032]